MVPNAFPEPSTGICETLAVPLASDFNERYPYVVSVAPLPTATLPALLPAVISSAVCRSADAFVFKKRFFNVLLPLVKNNGTLVPVIPTLEVDEPVSVPLVLCRLFIVSESPFIVNVPDVRFNMPATV